MAIKAPKIDPRTAADIEKQVVSYLQEYMDGGQQPVEPQGTLKALIKIFARYCEIIIDRLNRVPEKNFLAFLDLLGASRLPPQPARVPLTFSLAKGAPMEVYVPQGTQVAAQPLTGGNQPVIFETEKELKVTSLELSLACVPRSKVDDNVDASRCANQIHSEGFVLEPYLTLYICFSLPTNRKDFPQSEMSLFISVDDSDYSDTNPQDRSLEHEESSSGPPQVVWKYYNGNALAELTVADATNHLRRPGFVTFLPPSDFQPKPKDECECPSGYCIQVAHVSQVANGPRQPSAIRRSIIKGVLLNTVMATQAISIRNEVLGSSDGSERQKFRTSQTPVLQTSPIGSHRLQLEVREHQYPGGDEPDLTPDSSAYPRDPWINWHEVADFYDSSPRSRHYLINHLSGEIQFGDGHHGMIPPLGKSNIRMAAYQTGGGKAGNQPIGRIVQLKTTVPYVNGVTNHLPATGGADAETLEDLMDRMPRRFRHQGRAVSWEDYEDLAREASAEVARAKCFPLVDLSPSLSKVQQTPGVVSIVIVPRTLVKKPKPTLELIGGVHNFVKERTDPTARLVVVGPMYMEVTVTAELVVDSLDGASRVKQDAEQQLDGFLHPLTGGFDGMGWEFDRRPYRSDFYSLLEGVPGVDHVHALKISETKLNIIRADGFLVSPGQHSIKITYSNPSKENHAS